MALRLTCKKFLRLYAGNKHSWRLYSADCSPQNKGLVLGAFYNEDCKTVELTPTAAKFDHSCNCELSRHLKLAGNKVKAGKSLIFWGLSKEFPAIAVAGLGKKTTEQPNDVELINKHKEAVRIAASDGCRALEAVGMKIIEVEDMCEPEAAAEGSRLGLWKFQEYKTKKKDPPPVCPFVTDDAEDKMKWDKGIIQADAQNLARALVDTPANHLTPTLYSEKILEIFGSSSDVCVKIRDKDWAEQEKMGAFLAVAQGSCEPPKFVELSYEKGDGKPCVLVGKGVTFDTGGISLKPPGNMDAMRGDMGGSACIVATVYALAKLGVEANVKALIPMVENMPSGTAIKPGDVICARNGKTICVDNTDAEGRLILADALSYSATFDPSWVLDIATLTGAMAVSLGDAATGVFTNSNILYQRLEKSGSLTGDRVWRMPLWKHFTKQVSENAAYDLNNIGKGKGGGSCTAAAFLKEFVPEKTDWLHLDIAGVMGPSQSVSMPYIGKGMTGRPTRTLIEFVRAQFAH